MTELERRLIIALATTQALSNYIEDYIELVREGYRPSGFEQPPLPHCARVTRQGQVLAEWRPKTLSPRFPAESLVTAGERLGRGGIPAAVPNAPCSERLVVPKPAECAVNPDCPAPSSDPPNVARLGSAALTTG